MADTATPARSRRNRRFFEGMLVLAIALIILELLLRVVGLTSFVVYDADSVVGYLPRPNQHARYLTNSISINGWGLRDSRAFDTKTNDLRRVLVLGDSVTWGGVQERQQDLFTSQLELLLFKTEILNAGVNGYSVNQMVVRYRTGLKELAPDLIVVFAIVGDFLRPPMVQLAGNHLAYPIKQPRLAVAAAASYVRLLAANRMGWTALSPPATLLPFGQSARPGESYISENVSALESLEKELEGDATLVLVFSPERPPDPQRQLREEILQRLRTAGVKCIDLGAVMSASEEMFLDAVHLSTKGHGAVAEGLAAILQGKATL